MRGVIARSVPPAREFRPDTVQEFVEQRGACWMWRGAPNSDGYGRIALAPGTSVRAHRAVYEALVGPIPEGLEIDHTCHNSDVLCPGGPPCPHRRCVNPAHLEPVTHAENVRRASRLKTHCPSGHPYNEANTRLSPNGHRQCRACNQLWLRQYYRKHPERRNSARTGADIIELRGVS